MPLKRTVADFLFRRVHQNNLIYNCCWEDPACDRDLLNIGPDSQIVMITSAGCNAITYLLENPASISAVDVNPRQNALLNLKKALFQHGDYEWLYAFFGEGKHPDYKGIYRTFLRPFLSDSDIEFWDKHLKYFNGKGWLNSFYFNGTSGLLARMFAHYLDLQPKLKQQVRAIFQAENLEKQREMYLEIEQRLFRRPIRWALNRQSTLHLAGVPANQTQLILSEYPEEGVAGFVMDCFRNIFYDLPIQSNYFWYVYIYGQYDEHFCPEYLKERHFEHIRTRIDRIQTHDTSISQFLKTHPDQYSHFVLLDHQDWLASHDPESLKEEWELILQNSRPQTRVLLRSAASEVDFFPECVAEHVRFDVEAARTMHQQDRVGTYGSTYLGIVQ
ncbi:MAG: BtaA family protein [Bacteroidota bacterium]